MGKSDSDGRQKRIYRELTVADIRAPKRDADVEVTFLESARFYKLLRTNPTYDEALNLLRGAMTDGRALTIGLASLDTDIIEEIQESK